MSCSSCNLPRRNYCLAGGMSLVAVIAVSLSPRISRGEEPLAEKSGADSGDTITEIRAQDAEGDSDGTNGADSSGVSPAPAAGKKQGGSDNTVKRRRRKKTVVRSGIRRAFGDWQARLDFTGRLAAGAFFGEGVRRDNAMQIVAGAKTRGRIEHGSLRLSLPLRLGYQETPGASLRELGGAIGLDGRWQPTELLTVAIGVGVKAAYRPGWKDLYQPVPMVPATPPAAPTDHTGTDRYSFVDWSVDLGLELEPVARHTLSLFYRYGNDANIHDPAFKSVVDASPEPNHLVPSDRQEHRAGVGWRYRGKRLRLAAELDAAIRDSFFVFARDAGTGATHAGPGGQGPNPLQNLRILEPTLSAGLRLWRKRLRLNVSAGLRAVDDTFAGYYSYLGPILELAAALRFVAIAVDAGIGGTIKLYGPNSYAETSGWQAGLAGHPPLTFGQRRADYRFTAHVRGRYRFANGIAPFVKAEFVVRRANFPDYQPGVFPRTRNYSIGWNYENINVIGGLEYTL